MSMGGMTDRQTHPTKRASEDAPERSGNLSGDASGAPSTSEDSLLAFIEDEWRRPVAPAAVAAASALAAQYGDSCAGVLFYGSCLRTGILKDRILDFYILVDSYRGAYGRGFGGTLLAAGNAVLPPNVFYFETTIDDITVRCKYAVLSLDAYAYRCGSDCLNVSVWARFCQPAVLLNARSADVARRVAAATATALTTMTASSLALAPSTASADMWVTAFTQTYGAELRSEPPGKGQEIYDLDKDRYDRAAPLILAALEGRDMPSAHRQRRQWWLRRANGKVVSFLRLLKAAFTFQGGIDYLAWKITRHSGVQVDIAPWMRRVPIIAGLYLFIALRVKGAFR